MGYGHNVFITIPMIMAKIPGGHGGCSPYMMMMMMMMMTMMMMMMMTMMMMMILYEKAVAQPVITLSDFPLST